MRIGVTEFFLAANEAAAPAVASEQLARCAFWRQSCPQTYGFISSNVPATRMDVRTDPQSLHLKLREGSLALGNMTLTRSNGGGSLAQGNFLHWIPACAGMTN
jgi:hypothetical protein